MSHPDPYTADDATRTWDSIKDTPPRNPPGWNGRQAGPDYSETDAGNGQRLLDRYGSDLLYVKGRTLPWIHWTGNNWQRDDRQVVDGAMEGVMRDAVAALAQGYTPRHQLQGQARWLITSLDTSRIRAALAAASRHVTVTSDLFDHNIWLAPCANGLTYDLWDGSLRPSRREDYMSHCLPIAASLTPVPHPRWDALLALLMDGDGAMIGYLRQSIGLLLTGDVSEKCFWFWVGNTNTGKTTLLTVIDALLGGYAYKIPLRALLKRRDEMAIRHDLAGLQGVRLAYAEEFKVGDVLNEGTVKDITGGGKVTADRKGEANETFFCRAKLIIGTNELPAITDIDEAIRDRVRAVPFTVDIPARLGAERQSIETVVAGLLEEAPGILQDLVAAVGEWRAAGGKLVAPPQVAAATKRYLDTQDPMLAWMQTCCVEGGATEERPFAEWYWSFRLQSGRSASQASEKWFSKQLEAHKFAKRDTGKGPRYTGPRLTDVAAYDATEAIEERRREREARMEAAARLAAW